MVPCRSRGCRRWCSWGGTPPSPPCAPRACCRHRPSRILSPKRSAEPPCLSGGGRRPLLAPWRRPRRLPLPRRKCRLAAARDAGGHDRAICCSRDQLRRIVAPGWRQSASSQTQAHRRSPPPRHCCPAAAMAFQQLEGDTDGMQPAPLAAVRAAEGVGCGRCGAPQSP